MQNRNIPLLIIVGLVVFGLVFLAVKNLQNANPQVEINFTPSLSYPNLNNELFGFGSNFVGQLGTANYSKSPVVLQSVGLKNIVKFDAGNRHSLVLTPNGEVFQIGSVSTLGSTYTDYVNILDGDEVKRLTGIVDISAGSNYSLALKDDGTVWSWGSNITGQLGQGDNQDREYATRIEGLQDIVQISAGYKFGLALDKFGEVWAWGGSCTEDRAAAANNWMASPQTVVGIGGYYDPTSLGGADNINLQSEDYNSYCANEWVIGFTSKTPVKIEGLSNITQISAGWGHTLAIDANKDVWSFGCNLYGQVSNTPNHLEPYRIPELQGIVQVSAGYRHSMALDEDGNVFAWGHNLRGALGIGTSGEDQWVPVQLSRLKNVQEISAGHDFSVLINADNKLVVFGENNSGVVNSDLNIVFTPNPTVVYSDHNVSAISAGKNHILVLTDY